MSDAGQNGNWVGAPSNSGDFEPTVQEANEAGQILRNMDDANRAEKATFGGAEPEAVWTEIRHPRLYKAGAWIVRRLEIKI